MVPSAFDEHVRRGPPSEDPTLTLVTCRHCGRETPDGYARCGSCGAHVGVSELTSESRRLVTVVTSDLKGSTALGEQLDPESLREVLNRYFAVMRVVFESHGGRIEKIIGDAIVAVFGLPVQLDDDPIRAVEAAAETQRALATLNDELDQLWGVRLVNRTGIATGVIHFGRDAEGQHVLVGEAVDDSTAMEQNAPPQEVLMAESAFREVRDVVEWEDMGLKSPKGSERQIQSYRLASVRSRGIPVSQNAAEPAPGHQRCLICGEESPASFGYCGTCGASFAASVAARDSRKTVTIVFANPKPHMESGDPLPPEAFTDVMTRYFDAMKVALERHGGTVEKFIGDAVMAVFGLPVRHEDDALRAVRAAADMQAALPALNAAFQAQYGVRLDNHIGVNTGEVIATGDASTGQRLVTGDTVNTAARLEQAAGAAEIILGELTRRLTQHQVDVDVIEPLMLKGKAEPVAAYRFVAVRTRPLEGKTVLTTFVGREVEMARLTGALREAIERSEARLMTIVGDAGVGKSRLIREFSSSPTHEVGLLRGRCLPYGDGITFWPLAEVAREAAGIVADDSPEEATQKVGALLLAPELETEREAILERVAAMMNLSQAQFPVAELMWGARRLLETLAHERPLVVIIDDIQSAEQTFLDFIDYLIETAEHAPILLLCSARFELLERYSSWAEDHAEQTLMLVPLTEGETAQLVGDLLGDLEPSVRERIATAAEGNPLYTEQIVAMLQETGAIRRDGDRWVSTRASDQLAIPATVQALVAARLDALATEERAVIEPASVIGLSFAEGAIAELVEAELLTRLEVDLGSLAAKQLIRRASGDDAFYRFGHLVIKDTAYGSLLKRVRAVLHERFVVWAERVNKETGRETEFEEILGYHLEQAFRYRTELGVIDDDARAVGHRAADKLASAGRRALGRGDLPAAVSLLRRAVAVLDRETPLRIELLVDLGEGLLQQGQFDDAAGVVDEAHAIATGLGADRYVVRADLIKVGVDQFRSGGEGGSSHALDVANKAIAILEPLGDAAGLARAWRLAMITRVLQGRLEEASHAAERVVEYATEAGDGRLASRSASVIAYILLHGPAPVSEAIPQCEELLVSVQGDRTTEVGIQGTLAVLLAMDGRPDVARDLYRRSQSTLEELGAGLVSSSSSIDSSRVELLAGDVAAAERELRSDYDALTAIDESYFRSTIAAYLAGVLWLMGDPDGALAFTEVAEEIGDAEDILTQVPWRSVRAKVYAVRGDRDEALRLATEAVQLAGGTSHRHLLAEALTDLADVHELTGDPESAGPPLREALSLFEQKGDVVSAGAIHERLGAVAAG